MDTIKLLIVDDSHFSRMWLQKALPSSISTTAQIEEVHNGKEAVELYKTFKPDLVFMDITMPIMDGFEALELIRKYDENAKVVMVSADRQQDTKRRVLELGAITIINKPIDISEFKQVLLENLFGD